MRRIGYAEAAPDRPRRSARIVSPSASTARSSSSWVTTSGGEIRIVAPWVSLTSTPRAASASLTARPSPSGGPRPRPPRARRRARRTTPFPTRPASLPCRWAPRSRARCQQIAVLQQPDHRTADRAGQRVAAEGAAVLARSQDAEHVARPRRRPTAAGCRRRGPCRAGRRRRRRPRARGPHGARCARAPTAPRRRRRARRGRRRSPGPRPGSQQVARRPRPRPGWARPARRRCRA